jgi:hypothetical protein
MSMARLTPIQKPAVLASLTRIVHPCFWHIYTTKAETDANPGPWAFY